MPQQTWQSAAGRASALAARRGRPALRVVLAIALAALIQAPPVLAAGDPKAAKGVIVEHCVSCHEVPGLTAEARTPSLEAPSFQAVATDPATYTDERLRRFLRQPHWPMGQFRLSGSDIDNILAFIESLRRN